MRSSLVTVVGSQDIHFNKTRVLAAVKHKACGQTRQADRQARLGWSADKAGRPSQYKCRTVNIFVLAKNRTNINNRKGNLNQSVIEMSMAKTEIEFIN
jgi:hypothetical protein